MIRFPKDSEIIDAMEIESTWILVRKEGGRTTTDAGLTLASPIKTPFSKVIKLGPEYKGNVKIGDRLLYTEAHPIPEVDDGKLSVVNPSKICARVPADLFETKETKNDVKVPAQASAPV